MQQLSKRTILAVGGFCLLAVLFLIAGFFQASQTPSRKDTTSGITSEPTVLVTLAPKPSVHAPPLTDIPKLPGTTFAPDTTSQVVRDSREEIARITPFLPYLRDYTLSTGVKVSIVIPGKELQDDPWKLTVQVFGINYNVTPQDKDYARMHNSFLEAASYIYTWMRDHGADPNKVLIKWGDQAYIQNRAVQWLE